MSLNHVNNAPQTNMSRAEQVTWLFIVAIRGLWTVVMHVTLF